MNRYPLPETVSMNRAFVPVSPRASRSEWTILFSPCSKSRKTWPGQRCFCSSSLVWILRGGSSSTRRSVVACGHSLTRSPCFRRSPLMGSNSYTPKRKIPACPEFMTSSLEPSRTVEGENCNLRARHTLAPFLVLNQSRVGKLPWLQGTIACKSLFFMIVKGNHAVL